MKQPENEVRQSKEEEKQSQLRQESCLKFNIGVDNLRAYLKKDCNGDLSSLNNIRNIFISFSFDKWENRLMIKTPNAFEWTYSLNE